ncbi:MAG TPA: hypothetical protein VEJ86_11455 [Candidatus Binataceae bacterium]|nr:hypothetical protein [Candidatus Binataceae bacterium]
MFERIRPKLPLALMLAVPALAFTHGTANAGTFSAPLVQCTKVTVPSTLSGCPATNDPLSSGFAVISDQGDVTVAVAGAAHDTPYSVTFVSGNGATSTALGTLSTDQNGDGVLRKLAFFKFGIVGAGNVVLSSGSDVEFISGVSISSNGLESAADFQPALVRCADVVVPGAQTGCGSDPLTSGHVDVENEDGSLSIHIVGATPSQSYTAIFRSESGSSVSIGTVGPTDSHGNATLDVTSQFAASTVGSGSIVLQVSGVDQFVSGFKVNVKFIPPPSAVSSLVPCDDVINPGPSLLSNCGSDPLSRGGYEINTEGRVSVEVTGAAPSTNYEVWFRPLDNTGDVDTGLELSTDTNGDGAASKANVFPAGSIDSGTLVVKQSSGTTDEFVPGFKVH